MDQGAEQNTGSANVMGSAAGKDRSHLVEQVGYAGNLADVLTKHVPRAVVDKLAVMMNYTFPGEETVKFQAYANINESYWNQKVAAVEKLPVFDDGDHEKLEQEDHSFVDKTTHLTTAVLRRGVEINLL